MSDERSERDGLPAVRPRQQGLTSADNSLVKRGLELLAKTSADAVAPMTSSPPTEQEDRLALAYRCLREGRACWCEALPLLWNQPDHGHECTDYATRAYLWALVAIVQMAEDASQKLTYQDASELVDAALSGDERIIDQILVGVEDIASALHTSGVLQNDIRPHLTGLRDVFTFSPDCPMVNDDDLWTLEGLHEELRSSIRAISHRSQGDTA